jgi:hypothetical protein
VIGADNRLHLSGSLPNLYESGSQSRIYLTIDGSNFSGFDYEAQIRFSGQVSGGGISLYDYATARQYRYR